MTNKKGFTLIELLAVIVVLAIIVLIATPIILGVIEKAKSGAVKSSVLGYIDAVEKQTAVNLLDTSKEDIVDKEYTVDELATLGVKIKGQGPDIGYVTIIKGKVEEAILGIDKKQVGYSNSKTVIIDSYDDNFLYKETILNGTDPVISDNLVPVTIENDGIVKKADIKSNWYNYSMKKWANAVILKDENITYSNNETIPEENIESYFVWIPRYRYRLWYTDTTNIMGIIDENKIHSIDIVFENKDVIPTLGTENGDYLTHPAFTTLDVNGIWVGKFEITRSTSDITIKPGEVSLRSQTVKTFFDLSYNYNRDLGSHMMKNTEWGAVSYLSHSKFGINDEININNNSLFKTGYSALPSTNQQTYPGVTGDGSTFNEAYNTSIGYLASTTGNITGIYDMSGGAHEYMASYMSGQVRDSGFNTTTIANTNYTKYLDVYSSSSTVDSYQYRILGDATGEMGPFKYYLDGDNNSRWHNSWHSDYSYFVDFYYPWFTRGGHYELGVLAGQFFFDGNAGGVYAHIGSRLVLAK